MTFSNPIFLVDIFRNSYQGTQLFTTRFEHLSKAEKITIVMKQAITLLDALFTLNHYTSFIPSLEAHRDAVNFLRIVSFFQSYKLLKIDNNASINGVFIRQEMIFNLFLGCHLTTKLLSNVLPSSHRMILVGLSEGFLFGDSIARIISLFPNFSSRIADGIIEFPVIKQINNFNRVLF